MGRNGERREGRVGGKEGHAQRQDREGVRERGREGLTRESLHWIFGLLGAALGPLFLLDAVNVDDHLVAAGGQLDLREGGRERGGGRREGGQAGLGAS